MSQFKTKENVSVLHSNAVTGQPAAYFTAYSAVQGALADQRSLLALLAERLQPAMRAVPPTGESVPTASAPNVDSLVVCHLQATRYEVEESNDLIRMLLERMDF